MMRFAALVLAYFFLALAVVGVFVPGLPTVPFLLLTAWFAAKGSRRLHTWLYAHPHLGKLLIDWEEQKAISHKSKIIAVLTMTLSWVLMCFRLNNVWVLTGLAVLFAVIGGYLVSRPLPK